MNAGSLTPYPTYTTFEQWKIPHGSFQDERLESRYLNTRVHVIEAWTLLETRISVLSVLFVLFRLTLSRIRQTVTIIPGILSDGKLSLPS